MRCRRRICWIWRAAAARCNFTGRRNISAGRVTPNDRPGLYYETLAGGARINPSQLEKFDQVLLKTAFSLYSTVPLIHGSHIFPEHMSIERYQAVFAKSWEDDTPIVAVRFVLLDTETTGLVETRDLRLDQNACS
jgi:hypothetical protein